MPNSDDGNVSAVCWQYARRTYGLDDLQNLIDLEYNALLALPVVESLQSTSGPRRSNR